MFILNTTLCPHSHVEQEFQTQLLLIAAPHTPGGGGGLICIVVIMKSDVLVELETHIRFNVIH